MWTQTDVAKSKLQRVDGYKTLPSGCCPQSDSAGRNQKTLNTEPMTTHALKRGRLHAVITSLSGWLFV